MRKYKFLCWDGTIYLLPIDLLHVWQECIDTFNFKAVEKYSLSISMLYSLEPYFPDKRETIDTLFDLDALKREQEQVMKLLTDTQNTLTGQALREKLVLASIQYAPHMQLNHLDTLIKYIINGITETT